MATQRVLGHHAEHDPVEALSLHHAPDEEAEHLLLPPEVGRALVLATLQIGTGKGRPWDRKKSHHTPSQQGKGWRGLLGTALGTHTEPLQAPETAQHKAANVENGLSKGISLVMRDEGWDFQTSWISAQLHHLNWASKPLQQSWLSQLNPSLFPAWQGQRAAGTVGHFCPWCGQPRGAG